MHKTGRIALIGWTLIGVTVGAQAAGNTAVTHSDAPPASASTVSLQAQLDALNAENALLTVELKNKELRDKINGVSETKAAAAQPGATPVVTHHASRSDNAFRGDSSAQDAKITLISGTAAHPVATILRHGATFNVSPGTTIRGLGVVKSVSLDGVEIQSGATTYTLPFEADASADGNAGGMSSMGGMGEPGMGGQLPMGMPMAPMLTPPPSLPGSK